MHAARLSTPRLTRLLTVLKEAKRRNEQLSTLEIGDRARICAVSTAISELRSRGAVIMCLQYRHRFYYWLVKAPTTPRKTP